MAQNVTNKDTSQEASGLERTLGTSDHKTIGRMWILSGALLLVVGIAISLVAGVEQVSLGGFSIAADADELIQIWSAGRVISLFGGVVAVLVGLATYLVPLQVGASAIAFGRGAAAAFWIWAISVDLLAVSYLLNGGPGGGRRDFVVLWIICLGAAAAAICWALVCIATTVLAARAPGMILERAPLSAWGFAVWALLGLVVLPLLIGQLGLAYLDVRYGYLSEYALLAHAMDSILLAPAILWLAIPTMALAAEIVGVHSGSPIRFHRGVMAAIAVLSLVSFGGDMFGFVGSSRIVNAQGELAYRSFQFDNALLVLTLFAAVAPLLALVALIGDRLRDGRATMNAPMLGALTGAGLTLLAAMVALLGTIEPIVGFFADITDRTNDTPDVFRLNGTTFNAGVSALVVGGAIAASLGALHHWAHKIWGRHLTNGVGAAAVVAVVAGSLAAAVGNIGAGMRSQPALPAMEASPMSGVELFNGLTAIGILLALLGVAAFALDLVRTAFARGTQEAMWTGHTLEWLAASPPVLNNFDVAPEVVSAFPLIDMAAANLETAEHAEVDA